LKRNTRRALPERPWSWLAVTFGLILHPVPALALQSHGGLEGLYVHQVAHVFFAFSMGLLIFWLRKRRLTASLSWRYIQYAAMFLIAWNADTITSHWLLEQSGLIDVQFVAPIHIHITTAEGWQWVTQLYYLTKLDHLLCVPALVFLFLGLRRLLNTSHLEEDQGDPVP
jgi:hypothetical protein